jgi:hypothetical protein
MTSNYGHPDEQHGRRSGDRFDGWSGYAEWAEHDFRARRPEELAGAQSSSSTLTIEVLTHLSPISLPDIDMRSMDVSRLKCRVMPGGNGPGECFEDGILDIHLDIDIEANLIRPYVRTGGRVTPGHVLEFESILTSTGLHENWSGDPRLGNDQMVLCEHCQTPQSVAEIAASLSAPIGLVKVLISDAIDRGLLVLHDAAPTFEGRPPVALLRRVHASLAKLT